MMIRRSVRALLMSLALALLPALAVIAQEGQYYVLDGFGGVHAGGGAPGVSPAPPYFGFDVAIDMTYVPAHQTDGGESGILVLDSFGGVHAGGELASDPPSNGTPYFGFDAARAIVYRDRRPQVMSAVVSAAGSLSQGSDGASSATRTATGTFVVMFDRSIKGCAWVAGIGGISAGGGVGSLVPVPLTIRSDMFTGGTGIIYQVTDPDGTAVNANTHVIVTCPLP